MRIAVLGALIMLLPVVPVQAEPSVADMIKLSEAKKSAELSLPTLKKDMDEITQQSERWKREYDIYADQMKTRLAPIANAYEAKVKAHNERTQRANAEIARHNSVCTGTLPKPQFDKCQSERPTLQRLKDEISGSKSRLDTEKANLTRESAKYTEAMGRLSSQMKANFEKWQQRKKTFDDNQRKIAEYRTRLVSTCQQARTPEALKHCHSISWDGARPDLPSLPSNIQTGTVITPNK